MRYIRIVTAKGNTVHHLNTDMRAEEFERNISSGKVFFARFGSNHVNRIDPLDVIMWEERETEDGIRPTFMY